VCGLSWYWVLILIFVDLVIFGIVIVAFVSSAKSNKKVQNPEPVKFKYTPPQWFVDQWIAQHCPQDPEQKNNGSIVMLFFVIVSLIMMVYLIFW